MAGELDILMQERLERWRTQVEDALAGAFTDLPVPYRTLLDAMRYSLLAGGKRLRPILVLEFCRLCGGDTSRAMPVACGVEMLHTYSLFHDDLPCMDNDDLRRGKPTNHKRFGECTATLAGDALQAAAFESVLSADLPDAARARCALILASVAGHAGICGGQQLDMEWEGRTLGREELMEVHLRKTAALLRGACLMGVAAAGGSAEQERAAIAYADALGLAFQIRDDMLDVIGDEASFGKPIGSDKAENKTTFVDLLGLPGCEAEVQRATEQAVAALDGMGDTTFLIWLAHRLAQRSH